MCIAAYRLEHLGYLIAVLSSCFSGLDNRRHSSVDCTFNSRHRSKNNSDQLIIYQTPA